MQAKNAYLISLVTVPFSLLHLVTTFVSTWYFSMRKKVTSFSIQRSMLEPGVPQRIFNLMASSEWQRYIYDFSVFSCTCVAGLIMYVHLHLLCWMDGCTWLCCDLEVKRSPVYSIKFSFLLLSPCLYLKPGRLDHNMCIYFHSRQIFFGDGCQSIANPLKQHIYTSGVCFACTITESQEIFLASIQHATIASSGAIERAYPIKLLSILYYTMFCFWLKFYLDTGVWSVDDAHRCAHDRRKVGHVHSGTGHQ
jgi:hypothetical protein